jgi:hypothetical protein
MLLLFKKNQTDLAEHNFGQTQKIQAYLAEQADHLGCG